MPNRLAFFSTRLPRPTVILGILAACMTAPTALASDNQWLSREIPQVIVELLREDTPVRGLFAPALAPEPGLPPAPVIRIEEAEADSDNEFLPDPAKDLPSFPEGLLRQAPSSLGRVQAPDAERAGVPEPVSIREMWTFNTPVDRITPLKNAFSTNGRAINDLPSQLVRVDHLRAESLPTDYWVESARLQKLPPEALYAVALQESGMRVAGGDVQPWPWTLNCNAPCPHGAMRFASKQAASEALEKLLKAGWRNIDIGAMQINYRAHAKRFASYDLLDPRINLIVGGVILREAVQQAGGNLRSGFGLYHVGVLQSDNASRAEHYAGGVSRWLARVRNRGSLQVARQ